MKARLLALLILLIAAFALHASQPAPARRCAVVRAVVRWFVTWFLLARDVPDQAATSITE